MGLKREILQIIFGSILLALLLQLGWLSPTNRFWDNVVTGIVVMVVSRILSRIFGGR